MKNIPDFKTQNIFLFWHSKMIVGWWLFKNKKVAAIVSKSSDGELLNNLLVKWNYKVVRGSNSKGGKEALQELIIESNNGYSTVITPDGPRGPVNEIKNGALIISHHCKIPVIPLRIEYKNKFILKKSWDSFEIPLPFSKCSVNFGNAFYYTEYLYGNELEEFKHRLSQEMN